MNPIIGNPTHLIEWYEAEMNYPNHPKHQADFEDDDWCYVFGNLDTGLYKIGITKNLWERWRAVGNASGCGLNIVLAINLCRGYDEAGGALEQALHKFFKQKRVRGEWFKLAIRDLVAIRALFWRIEGDDLMDYLKSHLEDVAAEVTLKH